MKILLTAITRPRTKSGVFVCGLDFCQSATLTLSNIPVSASIAHDRPDRSGKAETDSRKAESGRAPWRDGTGSANAG